MKNKIYILTHLCLILGLTSCTTSNVDITVRPKDYKLDYWLTEIVDVTKIDKSLFYKSKYEGSETYLDSRYNFINVQGQKELPEKYVTYNVNLGKSMIQTIIITDPSITIYGLSMKSSETSIKRKLLRMGFTYQEYSGMNPSYMTDDFNFTINKSKMLLEVLPYSDLLSSK